MRKKQEKQGTDVLEIIRHDLRMRDFELVFTPPMTIPLRFHVVARADDLEQEDIPGYISVLNEIRRGLYECEADPEECLRALEDDRVCTLSEGDVQAFLDIVEESTLGKVSTYEACDDGLAYRIELTAESLEVPEFIAVEQVSFLEHSLSAITAFSYVREILDRWPELRDQWVQQRPQPMRPGLTFSFSPKKTLPS